MSLALCGRDAKLKMLCIMRSSSRSSVAAIVDKNYGPQHVKSSKFYTHFSLLKTIEAGFRLPCLNHACDESTNIMSDLFGE